MYNYILVPLDGSERAEAILPHVVELAKRYDAQVILLQVVETVPLNTGPEGAAVAWSSKSWSDTQSKRYPT